MYPAWVIVDSIVNDLGPILGLVAFLVALLTFVASQIQQSRTLVKAASTEWVSILEKELELTKAKLIECEEMLADCVEDRKKLHEEADEARHREYRLMRRVEVLEERSR